MKFRAFSVCGGILRQNSVAKFCCEIIKQIPPMKFSLELRLQNSITKFKAKIYGRNFIAKILRQASEINYRGKIPRLKILRKYEISYLIADRFFGLCSVDFQGLNAARRACLRHKILHTH